MAMEYAFPFSTHLGELTLVMICSCCIEMYYDEVIWPRERMPGCISPPAKLQVPSSNPK